MWRIQKWENKKKRTHFVVGVFSWSIWARHFKRWKLSPVSSFFSLATCYCWRLPLFRGIPQQLFSLHVFAALTFALRLQASDYEMLCYSPNYARTFICIRQSGNVPISIYLFPTKKHYNSIVIVTKLYYPIHFMRTEREKHSVFCSWFEEVKCKVLVLQPSHYLPLHKCQSPCSFLPYEPTNKKSGDR